MAVKISRDAQELLADLGRRMNRDPVEILNRTIAHAAAGYFNLESIIPTRACLDPHTVLGIVEQLPENDHSMPVTVTLPPEVTGGALARTQCVPLTW